jgi:hypothetical protein
MTSQVSWIAGGRLTGPPDDDGAETVTEDYLLQWQSWVKITHGLDGTEIKWSVFSANWASLYFVLEWIETYPGPFTLKYYLLGWFEEIIETANEARERIETIIAKSDIHLTQRTFIRDADPGRKDIAPLLRNALVDKIALPDHSIDCIYDEEQNRYRVERIGSETPIAKVFGFHPVSYPCINGLSYDQMVSEAYGKAIASGKPHYDHVIAAMTTPHGSVVWFPYQRVILPRRWPDGRTGVSVVSQVARVDIRII